MTTVRLVAKALVAALGVAVQLAVLLPAEQVPASVRPWVGVLVALATVVGVWGVPNRKPAAPAGQERADVGFFDDTDPPPPVTPWR